MKQAYRYLSILMVLMLVLFSTSLFAQGVTSASLNGLVFDADGEPLPAANVIAVHEPSGTQYGVSTREDGRFNLPNVRIGGPYSVKVSFVGYKDQIKDDIYLTLGQNFRVEFTLQDESVEIGEVVVSAEQDDDLNADRTGAATNIKIQELEQLPTISRSIGDYTRLTPQASGNSFAGRNEYYNNFSLDGTIFNNSFGLDVPTPGGQANAQPVSLDAIEQIQVSIAPFDVRQGGFTGAGVNSVTRSGTNEFKGSIYNFLKNEGMIGKKVGETEIENPDFSYNQFGLRLGGPIIKNKLFFFGNFEMVRRDEPATTWLAKRSGLAGSNVSNVLASDLDKVSKVLRDVYGYDPGRYENYQHKTENEKILFKVDWNINQDHDLSVRYNYLKSWRDVLPHPAVSNGGRGPSINSIPFENTSYQINNNINSVVAILNSRFSNLYSNRLLVSYTAFRDFRESKSADFVSKDIDMNGTNYISFGLERFSTNNILDQDVLQITDDFTFYLPDHILTAGVSFEWFKFMNSFNLFYYPGLPSYSSMDDFLLHTNPDDPANFHDFNQMVRDAKNSKSYRADDVSIGQLAFYLQDEWQVNQNLKLTGGLRVDIPTYFTEPEATADTKEINSKTYMDENGNTTKIDVTKLPDAVPLWSPRFGFNWNIDGQRKTQLRGGTGIFTGRLRFVWIGNQISNSRLDPFYTFQVNATHPDFKWPQVWRSNLGLDHDFGDGLIGTLEGIYSKDINAVVHRNYNMAPPSDKLSGADNREVYQGNENKLNGFFDYPAATGGFLDAGTIVLDNTDEGYQYSITGKLRKNFTPFIFTSLAYTYSQSKDLTSTPGEIAADAFQLNPVVGNVNKPSLAYSDFGLEHRFIGVGSWKVEYAENFATTISLFFEAGQGQRFSYVYAGDVNNDLIPQQNDLMYIPANSSEIVFDESNGVSSADQWALLDAYIKQDDYLSERRGQYAERNGAISEWFAQIDLRILQDFYMNFAGRRHTLQLSLDILNIGNMISSDWGVRTIPQNKAPLSYTKRDDSGRPMFQYANPELKETFINDNGLISRWQMQFGIRYIFD